MSCSCTSCPYCKGSGRVWIAFDGTYLGNSRCDDLDELQTCDDCDGTGCFDMCDECHYAAEELEWLEDQRRI